MANFYCMKVCGDGNFSIKEWNLAMKECELLGLSKEETNKILHPEEYPCEKQCNDCLNVVLDTQIANKKN